MFRIVIKDKTFTSLEEFGQNMYLYPEACETLLTSTKFLKALGEENKELLTKLIKLNHEVRDVNEFLFQAQYLFCPHMGLKHHTYSFETFKELGKQILEFGPKVDIYLKDFLKFKLLSRYMVDQGYDTRKAILYKKVLELEEMFFENENKAYFLLGFLLAESDRIIFNKKEYDDVETFFKDMISDFYIINYAHNLESNQYIYAWLEVKGLNRQVSKYHALLKTIEQLEEK
ncbi:MAG: hypothetical protein E7177_03955 [Erysipelotrichaceae bacterium]|nr:hypothetical protein [Erysipelotrichaceae bacterium]